MTNLEAHLKQLEQDALVRRAEESDPTYLFRHALTHESIYGSLLRPMRRETHRAVARAYETLYSDRLDEYADLLAGHYAAAADDDKALEYSIRAGDAAMHRYANVEAISHYARAIDILLRTPTLGDSKALSQLFVKRGRVMETSGRQTEALRSYEEMEGLAHQRGDRAMELGALVAQATIRSTSSVLSDEHIAHDLLDRALALSRDMSDGETEAKVLWILVLLKTSKGEMQQAVAYGEESLALSRRLGMHAQTAITLNDLFRPYNSVGQYEKALKAAGQAREYFRTAGNQAMLADNLGRSSVALAVFGDFDAALELSAEAYRVGEAIGNPWSQSFSQMFTGNIYFVRGEVGRAITTMRDCIRLADVSGFLMPQIWTRADLAAIYGELGSMDDAILLANQAHALAHERLPHGMARVHAVLARLYLLNGDVAKAESEFEEGKAHRVNDFSQRAFDRLPIVEIQVELEKTNWARAVEIAEQFLSSESQVFVRPLRGDIEYLRGQALCALGNLDDAKQAWLNSLAEAEKSGSKWLLWQVYAALGQIGRARAIVNSIAESIPAEPVTPGGSSMRESFLNLPEVQHVLT